MCRSGTSTTNALITAQDHGAIVLMVTWSLICLLVLCTLTRVIARWRTQRLRRLPLLDDVFIIGAASCGLGAVVVVSMAVDAGLGKRECLLSSLDIEEVQFRVFVATILAVLALSISKCSILVFLHQVAHSVLQKVGIAIIGMLVLIWTVGVLAGTIFQCEMPQPWEIWTGKCIPLVPFWVAATIVDIVVDLALVLLSTHAIWTIRLRYQQKSLAATIIFFRILLVAMSVIRLVYLQQAFGPNADSTLDYVPYAVLTQGQTTLSIILACSMSLGPLTSFLQISRIPLLPSQRNSKHWSGTTIGGTPYERYSSFASSTQIIKEPLPSIQASMSTPTSPAASRHSLSQYSLSRHSLDKDILLPDILLPTRYNKTPPRPPPPAEDERPDLSMFHKKTEIREPPMVTRLGSTRSAGGRRVWERVGMNRNKSVARGMI